MNRPENEPRDFTPVLGLKQEFFNLVREGRKTSTIRAGKRRIRRGPLYFVSETERIRVFVTDTETRRFGDLTEKDAVADGFTSLNELRQVLLDIYPNLHPDTPVTIIRFQPESLKRNPFSIQPYSKHGDTTG